MFYTEYILFYVHRDLTIEMRSELAWEEIDNSALGKFYSGCSS